MTTSPQQGITVYTTTMNTYAVAGGVYAETAAGPTGELTAEVFGAKDDTGNPVWLASFGNAEAVYVSGAVAMTAQSAAARGGL